VCEWHFQPLSVDKAICIFVYKHDYLPINPVSHVMGGLYKKEKFVRETGKVE
jgi:hypothetical protein